LRASGPEGGEKNMAIAVLKRDGTTEDWDIEKVRRSIVSAGTSVEESDAITKLIEGWAQRFAENGVVKSSDIKAKAIELMKAVNSSFTQAFEEYQKVR